MVEADVEGNDLGPILPDAYRIKLKDVSAQPSIRLSSSCWKSMG